MKTATLNNALINVSQINGDILIEPDKVTCCDGSTFIQVKVDLDLPTMLVDKTFVKVIQSLPEAEIFLRERLVLTYGSNKVEFPIRDPIQFPRVQGVEKKRSITVNSDLFKTALQKLTPFTGEDLFSNIAMFDYGMAATNTYCIAEFRMSLIEGLIPKNITSILNRSLAGNVIIATDDRGISFESGNFYISTPMWDGKFPAYQKFLRPQGLTFQVERGIFVESLRRVAAIVNEENQPVKLTFNNGLTLFSESVSGSITETIPCGEGQFEIWLDSKRLLFTLEKMKNERITLKVNPDFVIRDSEEEFVLLNSLNVAE